MKQYNIFSILNIGKIIFLVTALYLIIFSINFLYTESKRPKADEKLNYLPDENNRIYHPNGISIILPRGWTYSFRNIGNDDVCSMIELRAEITRRYKCTIIVFEYNLKNYPDEVANDHSYKAVTFQELPALEKLTIKKRSKYEEPSVWIEDPSTVTVEKYFLRNGRCYHILSHFMFCETVPTNLPLYLDSFNVNAINQDIKND